MSDSIRYEDIDMKQVEELAKAGKTERQIALELGVGNNALRYWKKKHPQFKDLLQAWKYDADEKVERSLYERATGYDYVEDKVWCNADGIITKTEVVKHVVPDVKAIIFWLKNRQSDRWKDKTEHEHSGQVDLANSILAARKRKNGKEESIYD